MGVDRLGKRNERYWITGVSMGQREGYEKDWNEQTGMIGYGLCERDRERWMSQGRWMTEESHRVEGA
jgi:hypothetical protein